MKPLVTAIVSTYNSEMFIRGKIEDLLNQSIADKLEIVVINSGSEQNEEEIIKPFLVEYKNIKYQKTDERETIYKAWNRGIQLATGKYITNSNTDDRLRHDAFQVLSDALEADQEVGMVYGDQYITSVENQPFDISKKEDMFRRLNFSRIRLLSEYIPGSQSMWRGDIHSKYKIYFNEKYEIAGDYDFVLRVAEVFKIKRVDAVLGSYYKSAGKKNKEFQNISETLREAREIKSIYLHRYIESMPEEDVKNLSKKAKFIDSIPFPIFYSYRLLFNLLKSRNKIPPKGFWHNIRQVLQEKEIE